MGVPGEPVGTRDSLSNCTCTPGQVQESAPKEAGARMHHESLLVLAPPGTPRSRAAESERRAAVWKVSLRSGWNQAGALLGQLRIMGMCCHFLGSFLASSWGPHLASFLWVGNLSQPITSSFTQKKRKVTANHRQLCLERERKVLFGCFLGLLSNIPE